ncbi:MAG: ABC transporter permease, partial [Phycisphaerales bacterium]
IVLTLGLGIGAITAVFSVIHAVVLRPLPFDDPDRLVLLGETHRTRGDRGLASYPNFMDWQERNTVFEEIAAYYRDTHTLTGTGIPEHIEGARVTAGFFPTLGVKAAIGRLFSRHDDVPGSENVVVLSNGFWQRCFGGEPGVIGRTVVLDGTAFTVIGVLPAGTIFPKGMSYSHVDVSEAEVWTPFALVPGQSVRGWRRLQVIGRLKVDVSPTQAQADMDIIAAQLERQYPADNTERGVELSSLHGELVANVRPALWLLFGAVGLVLLIACTNVANLLLARGNKRRKELAVRAAMGAGKLRLIRQLISESVLFAVIGGTLGVLLASWSTDGLVAAAPLDCPQAHTVGLNWRVLGFTLVVSVVAGTVFGIAPAILGSRVDLRESLEQGGGSTGAEGRIWLRGALVIGEISLALMLLVGAGLLVRSLHLLT